MEEEDKYYIIEKDGKFKGFLIAETVEFVRESISDMEGYTADGTYITKKSKVGKD